MFINALSVAEKKMAALTAEEVKKMLLGKYPQEYLDNQETVDIDVDGNVYATFDAKTFALIGVDYYSTSRF